MTEVPAFAASPPFAGMVFRHAISLGANCEAAHQLRRNGRHTVRGPFDWLVTPLDALAPILDEDGERLAIRFVAAHAGTSVRCDIYDVLYHHEFPRGSGQLICFDAEAVARCRAKMVHKWESLVQACTDEGPVLFLRFWAETDLPWDRLGPGKSRLCSFDLDRLITALDQRFPTLDYRLLVLLPRPGETPDLAAPFDTRIAVRSVERGTNDDWAVTDAAWSDILNGLQFHGAPKITALGETLHWSGETDLMPTGPQPPARVPIPDEPVATMSSDRTRSLLTLACTLRDALAAARPEAGPPAETARIALSEADLPPSLRQMAGQVLAACGLVAEALPALYAAYATAPGLPGIAGQIASLIEVLGEPVAALAWLRRAAAEDPLMPGLYERLVRLQIAGDNPGAALPDLEAALAQRLVPATLAVEAGRVLWAAHRSHEAAQAFALAFRAGARDPDFLRDHLGLLTGEARYADVLDTATQIGPFDDGVRSRRLMLTGHARLALAHDRATAIAAARSREGGPSWLGPEAVLARARAAAEAGRGFSLIRVGDGEARFLIAMCPDLRPGVSQAEAEAIGAVVWENWFGEQMAASPEAERVALLAAYERAVATADVVGVSGSGRLRGDTGHYGYLAVQEKWLRGLRPDAEALWTDALCPPTLDRASPFLGTVLQDLGFVGAVSPHPGLARALAERFEIPAHAEYLIPAEGRLPTAEATRALGRHFPDLYRRTLDSLQVPHAGAVFLVAAGLLGKVYCGRIRELGGVAIDIGALADAWMGHDTRDGQLNQAGQLRTHRVL